jgi:AbrB family looped-hinge helix DNA binding protein
MRVTTKGQVTIPQEVREKLGIVAGSEVDFSVRGDTGIFRKASPKNGHRSRGAEIVARARGKGSVNRELTTDQIMALTRGWGEDDFNR